MASHAACTVMLAMLLPAAAFPAPAGDGTALIQRVVANPAACGCLNWKKIYGKGRVKCGDGKELHPKESQRPTGNFHPFSALLFTNSTTQEHEDIPWGPLCHDFPDHPGSAWFLHQDHSYCVKKDKYWNESRISKAWCYVSSDCDDLNGGKQVNQLTSWKTCRLSKYEGGSDVSLGELPVQDLIDLTKRLKTDLQLTVTMAYPSEAAIKAQAPSYDGPRILGFRNDSHYVAEVTSKGTKSYWAIGDEAAQVPRPTFDVPRAEELDQEALPKKEKPMKEVRKVKNMECIGWNEKKCKKAKIDCKWQWTGNWKTSCSSTGA